MRNRLLKLFRDNAPQARGFDIRAADGEVDLFLYDAIGGWFGIEAESLVKEIKGIDASTINVRINSPGGDAFDARAIHTALVQHPARVVSHIDGLAASAATMIALAGDHVEMAEGAFFMIHKAWTLWLGNADEMRAMADLLDKVDDSLIRDYAGKTGEADGQIREWMAAETWFSAEEAKAAGFADAIAERKAVENRFQLGAYDRAPKALTEAPVDDWTGARERAGRRIDMLTRCAA